MQELILLIHKMVAFMRARDPQTAADGVPQETLRNMGNEIEAEFERLAPVLGKHHHIPKH